jgi:hypothetical protein
VHEEPFEFSTFSGHWATPLGGASACLTIGVSGCLGAAGHAARALAVLTVMGLSGIVLATWLARRGVLGVPVLRARAVNLVATRGEPAVWLVAHLDTKSQPVPMLARVAGIVASSAVLIALLALVVAVNAGANVPHAAWVWVTGAGVVASLPVIASTVGRASPGAIDNASGAASVLRAATLLPSTARIGVALMSAEELGMAGAHAFAKGRRPSVALNVDGVDDGGTLVCMVHGESSMPRDAVRAAVSALSLRMRFGRTIPGILTDGVALANAGWRAVTLSRGSLATLARVPRATDDLDHLRGDGVEEMARILATAAQEIV